MSKEASPEKPSKLAAVLKTILYALLFAFGFGFLIGTLIRGQVEKPVRYIGTIDTEERPPLRSGVGALNPGHVRDTLAPILMPSHHEEEVGESIQIA